MKKTLIAVGLMILFNLLRVSQAWSESSLPSPAPAACPSCCETLKPNDSLSADDLMRINYVVKYTKFAKDYTGIGTFQLISNKGLIRKREWGRYRILLHNRSDVYDYKDLVVILGPQNIKGLSVLTWTYKDPERDQDVWLWLPSLRKIRRISQSEEDDPFMGSEFTTEDVSTRKWEDETYSRLEDKTFPGYTSALNNKTYYKDTACYVIEAKPKRKDWYYSKRIAWLDKRFGGLIFDEIYDNAGRKWKVFLKEYEIWENGCLPQTFLEAVNLHTENSTTISFEEEEIKFNTDLKESFFTERTLMRSKW